MLQNSNTFKFIVGLSSLVVILYGINYSSEIIVNILLSLFLAIILWPPISWLNKKGVTFFIALALEVILVVLVFLGVGYILSITISDFNTELPNIILKLNQKLDFTFNLLVDLGFENIIQNIKDFDYRGSIAGILTFITKTLASTLTNILNYVFIILLTTIFMLLEAKSISNKIWLIFKKDKNRINSIKHMAKTVVDYMETKFIISLVTALTIYILLILFNIKFALMWSVLTLLLNFIPNIGSIIATIPVVLQVFLLNDLYIAIVVTVLLISIHIIVGNIIEPKFMSKKLNLSVLVVWLSLLLWGYLLGPIGMILAVPLTASLKIILEMIPSTSGYCLLLSDTNYIKTNNKGNKKYNNYRRYNKNLNVNKQVD